MRIALVHDYLCGIGGAERVFQYICMAFPEADVYTLAYQPDKTFPYFKTRTVNVTYLNPFVRSMGSFRWSFPLATYVMQALNLKKYDVVLSSSASTAKYVCAANGKHICYCYTPTRALWNSDAYFGKSLKGYMFKPFKRYLQRRDYQAAQRIDKFIAISDETKKDLKHCYQRDASILYCPIDLSAFHTQDNKEDFFLIVSRLEYWKRVDYAVEAFNTLGLPLKIIGTGVQEDHLRKIAKDNIHFLGEVDDKRLALEYAKARAVIFTPFLEYGLIPLEANACGTPVICYGKGGVTETMIPMNGENNNQEEATAIFFDAQTPVSLTTAVERFGKISFNQSQLIAHASKWGVPEFIDKLQSIVYSQK